MEASTTSTEASIASMKTGGRFHGSVGSFDRSCGSFHVSGGNFHGSGGCFRDFHGRFYLFRGNFHFHGSWKPPWKFLEEASVDIPSGSFHGIFRGAGFTSIGFRELPSMLIYFHNIQALSGSFYCFRGIYQLLPLLPWNLPWKPFPWK